MKIVIFKTGHQIADTVADAVHAGLPDAEINKTYELQTKLLPPADLYIGYGILRGIDLRFKAAQSIAKPFILLDKGYWRPGHFGGFYRVSLNGTQQTTGLDKLEPDYERWDRLWLEIKEASPMLENCGHKLVCPPTDYVCDFFGFTKRYWETMNVGNTTDWLFRRKDCERPLTNDLAYASEVHTFNSSVGWEALRQGIPVVSDPNHSILGAYQKQVDPMSQMTVDSRRRFFAVQAGLQLKLEEIRSGHLWPLLQKLINASSVTMTAKQSVVT